MDIYIISGEIKR